MGTTWSTLSARQGRNELPVTLAMAALVEDKLTDKQEIAKGISDAWSLCEWPLRTLNETLWSMLFNKVLDEDQYLLDEEIHPASELPDTITLWRGATPDYANGMSWTDDEKVARWFAGRFPHREHKLYKIEATRNLVLARFSARRGEKEWVLDCENFMEDDVQEVPMDTPLDAESARVSAQLEAAKALIEEQQ